MASHHHHCHNLTIANPAPTCYCYTPYTPSCHHHTQSPPDPHHQPPQQHPHLPNLHQYTTPNTPCHHHPPPPPAPHHPSPQHHLFPNLYQYDPLFEECLLQGERKTQTTISSLIRRIAALESVLLRRSSTSSSHSLRDAAARIIQTHFRDFLLRRSRTLRQLKDLASIKSTLTILKSSVSEKTHFDYDVIHHKAMGLLLKLDVIQGGDPMIRDGKRSISRELNKFLDLINGFRVERSVNVSYRRTNVKPRVSNSEGKMRNVKHGGMKRADEEKLRGLLERTDKLAEELGEVTENPIIRKHGITNNRNGVVVDQCGPSKPKVNKSVSFAENGKVYKFLRRNFEPFLDEDCDESIEMGNLVDARELKDDRCREVEEIGVSSKEAVDGDEEEDLSEDGDSLPSSDDEEYSKSYPKKLR